MKKVYITTKSFPGSVFIEKINNKKYCFTALTEEAADFTENEAELLIEAMNNSKNQYFKDLIIYKPLNK